MDAKYYVDECLDAKHFAMLCKHLEQSQNYHMLVYMQDSFGDALELPQVVGAVYKLTSELESFGVPAWVLRDSEKVSPDKVIDFCKAMRMRAKRSRTTYAL